MHNAPQSDANEAPKRLFIPSLSLAFFATGKLDVISSLFLVDIALTFFGTTDNAAIGAASQIIVFSNIAAVIFGLLNGILSIRFKHKTILVFGSICIIIGTVGCILTPNFFGMQIFYPFDGIGSVTVGAMAFALIGELLPVNKRGKAIGYVTASGMLAATIGFPIAGVLAGINGWRSVLLLYVLPISILAVISIIVGIPSSSEYPKTIRKEDYIQSFKQVLLNKSATACLFGNMFMQAAGVWSFFAATFWRQQYLLSIEFAAALTLAVTLIFALGNLIGGRLVNRTGRKRLVIMTWTIRSLLIPLVVFMPDFNSALITSFLATAVGGIATTAGPSLTLEQAPSSRGTMMSINTVFGSLGAAIGSFLGGVALTQAGYYGLGFTFGVFGLLSVLIVLLLAKDPYKK
jgi:predicted MFS family arabinose efflux permease